MDPSSSSPHALPSNPVPAVPGKFTAIGTMRLIIGILHVLGGGILTLYCLIVGAAGFFTTIVRGLAVFCGIPYFIMFIIGIFEIISGIKQLKKDATIVKPSKWISILEIVFVLTCDVFAVAIGIVTLIFQGDDEVKQHYASKSG